MRRNKLRQGEFKPLVSKDRVQQIKTLVEECYKYVAGEIKDKPIDPLNKLDVDKLIETAIMSKKLVDTGTEALTKWLEAKKEKK